MEKRLKTGGRDRGTPNKLTKELRTILTNILNDELEIIPETLDKLEPKDRLEMVVKLLPYAMPKLESVNIESKKLFSMNYDIDPFKQIRESLDLDMANVES